MLRYPRGAATDVFVTEQAYQRFGDIVQVAGHLDVYVHAITDKAAKALSDTVHSTGIFAVCTSVLWSVDKALRGRPRLVSVPVQTSEPGNAGTMIRVSDAVGADSVILLVKRLIRWVARWCARRRDRCSTFLWRVMPR